MLRVAVILLAGALSACASPSSGPTVGDINSARLPNSNERIPIIDLADAPMDTPATAMSFAPTDRGLSPFQSDGSMNARLRRGDVIEVTVLDTGEEGLFSPTDSKTLNLGRFTVDESGFVTMPFVGRQRVIDSTPEGLQRQIVNGLRGSSVNPQAVVTVVDKPTSSVTVNGKVRGAGRFPLTSNRERVLDAIALAGGADGAPGATTVTLVRGQHRAGTTLARILSDDSQNIRLMPEDQIFVEGDASSFTAFGAFKSTGEFEFEPGKMSLAQAVGRAGGLLDDQANARHVYLMRNQPVRTDAAYISAGKNPGTPFITTKPVVYRIDMRQVSNLLLMQQFQIRDGDLLVATNANMVDAAKLVTVFQKSQALPAAVAPALN
ncbi:polysaccharide biosynthesis/export family protein [Mesorhizobium sp. CAU 1732]|uniref:polysaccharide biosynthesis/export family protein n=1 Tax=Mesorhizobium sp. CAU 1732 TaxID=3140358 RepID=UPI00326057B2